jgi:predicted aconitase
MGPSSTPHEAGFMKRLINLGEGRRAEGEEVAGERPLREFVTSRHQRAVVEQELRDRASGRANCGQRTARSSVDIGHQNPVEFGLQGRHRVDDRGIQRCSVDRRSHGQGRPPEPPRDRLHQSHFERAGNLGETGLVVGKSRLVGHKANTRVTDVALSLTEADEAQLTGEAGEANALAMRIVTGLAATMGATKLLSITGAHIDSCLFHGQSGIDFATRLADAGAQVSVPTTLNVSSLDLLHPDLYKGSPEEGALARELMRLYESMGCEPTWTCAPYQLEARPELGEHVAWAESNAIVFANSVLGARTHRYGDFIDICAAITGRAPAAGLHLDEHRRGEILFRLEGVSEELLDHDVLAPVLGYAVGSQTGDQIPVIEGLPSDIPEHRLKALGSAAASSGAVGMFHAVGITPEAPTLEAACGGRPPTRNIAVTPLDLRRARDQLTTATVTDTPLGAVSLGTPHYSIAEFERVVELLDGRPVHPSVKFFINTGRDIWHEVGLRGWGRSLEAAGIQIVTDTCTYITPVMGEIAGYALTDSAKWAHYAPGNLGIEVAFGSVDDCVESAVAGRLVRNDGMWEA